MLHLRLMIRNHFTADSQYPHSVLLMFAALSAGCLGLRRRLTERGHQSGGIPEKQGQEPYSPWSPEMTACLSQFQDGLYLQRIADVLLPVISSEL